MTEEQLAASREQLRKDLSNLPSAKDLAKLEVKNGADPKYIALKYGLGPEFVVACERWKLNQEIKRERASQA